MGLLKVVCDADPARRSLAATSFGAATTASFREVLQSSAVDVVVLAVPAAVHEELAIAAVGAGKDVLVEKPLALTLQGGHRILQAAQATGRIVGVGHLLEYHPAFLEIRRMLAAGELGRLQYIYSNRLNLGTVRTEENALWSFAPHDVALVLRLAGQEPDDVACHGAAYLSSTVADVTTTHMTFGSGVRAHIYVSWLHPFKEHRFVVIGSEGMAVFDDTRPWDEKLIVFDHKVTWADGHVPVAQRAESRPVQLEPAEPLRAECEAFVAAVRSRQPPIVSVEAGIRVLSVLERAQESLLSRPALGGGPTGDMSPFVHPTAIVDAGAVLGRRVRVWHFSHVSTNCALGDDSSLGQNTYVAPGVTIGSGTRVQNNVSIYEGVTLEDNVFCGPSVVFTNVVNPRSEFPRKNEYRKTLVSTGASLGANSTIVCGVTIGRYAMVGAGAVVARDVSANAVVVGVPARQIGWVCDCGERLPVDAPTHCGACNRKFDLQLDGQIVPSHR